MEHIYLNLIWYFRTSIITWHWRPWWVWNGLQSIAIKQNILWRQMTIFLSIFLYFIEWLWKSLKHHLQIKSVVSNRYFCDIYTKQNIICRKNLFADAKKIDFIFYRLRLYQKWSQNSSTTNSCSWTSKYSKIHYDKCRTSWIHRRSRVSFRK